METIQERLKSVIEKTTDERGRFAELEKLTQISANSWKSFWHGRQRPTCDMIAAVCERWPKFAFWLATGITDAKHGHVDSDGAASFPERRRARRKGAEGYWEMATTMRAWQQRILESKESADEDIEYGISHTQKIQLLELEIGRNAEQQALAGVEDAELVAELVKLKTPSYLEDGEQ